MRGVVAWLIILFACAAAAQAELPAVRTVKGRQKESLFVKNPLPCPITLTFQTTGKNLKIVPAPTVTRVIGAGMEAEVETVTAMQRGQAWTYQWTWHWEEGSKDARPDGTVYDLPYPSGKKHRVGQGYNGKFSHHGSEQFAIDWPMPEGSPVVAARAGVVVAVRSDSQAGGSDLKTFADKANYIHVMHSDGTIGFYLHLQHDGVLVRVGQRVKAGERIGLSGNTGFSSEPHLHFHVCVPTDGNAFHTVPVRFRTKLMESVELEEGKVYEAR